MTRPRLKALGITPQHTQKYVASGWIDPVAAGVFKRPGDMLTWQSALRSLQTQGGLAVHVGALTALEAHGLGHFVRMKTPTVFLFAETGTRLPKWMSEHDWDSALHLTQSKLLPPDAGITETSIDGFLLKTSSPERAILEALHLSPKLISLTELAEVIDSLRTLRPKHVQSLLETCNSTKVRRLFLFLAERSKLPVLKHLDLSRIDLGRGDRTLKAGGTYVAKYGLIVPKTLAAHG
jgi:hypothetical protein